jgi:hypothetical protein
MPDELPPPLPGRFEPAVRFSVFMTAGEEEHEGERLAKTKRNFAINKKY